MDNFDHASRLLFVLESVGNTVEPRYFEVPREMEKNSKQRGFEITGEA